jgi:hypothetical protein
MTDQSLQEISKKLDHLVALVATNMVKGMKQTAAILALNAAGLDRTLIAQIAGTTPQTVSVRLSEARSTRGLKSKKRNGA